MSETADILDACNKCRLIKPIVCLVDRSCLDCLKSKVELSLKCSIRQHCGIDRDRNVVVCASGGVNSGLLLYLMGKYKKGTSVQNKEFQMNIKTVFHVNML
eukprot:GHVR01092515.1.p1 GENE.GHVR01092515.1~~GHVR01092515.1.p1  ORF type:complete len:101 (+),score=5.27 GHVR01092515.1:217-519(+)